MTQEEKAKAYDEALEKAKKLYEKGTITESIGYIFPELAESEDEKIRKEIIGIIRNAYWTSNRDRFNKLVAWLEKQGNQKPQGKSALDAANEEKVDNQNCVKPSDKVEPKFHEGEWIVLQDKCCKVNYNGCGYELIDQMGLRTSLEYGTVDENAHIWNIIKDAEDGDVLVSDNIVFIFNKIHDVWINCHCSTHKDGSFMEEDYDLMTIKYSKEVYPATKEQRDTLMKAMADAGYEWDAEKKELKLLITNCGDFEQENCEQNSAWSEENERLRKTSISFLKHYADKGYENAVECIEWLKSLK